MRRWLSFTVEGAKCAATLDEAPGAHALVIVSGGNETRAGAHRGMAWLAGEVAAAGHPVLRFDRRGIGDSEGENTGFEGSAADITAALALLRQHCPQVTRITAFGNCDAAAALLLHDPAVDALLLSNPWTIDAPADAADITAGDDGGAPALPPSAAIRARYLAKLRNPREIWRLLTGGVNLGKLARGLLAARKAPAASGSSGLSARLGEAAARSVQHRRISFLIAEGDGTAQAFLSAWQSADFAAARANGACHILRHPTASHGFADDSARAWLRDQVIAALAD